MKKTFATVAGMAALTAACGGAPGYSGARATLMTADGRQAAYAEVGQDGDAIKVMIEARDLAPGTYGAHLHAIGNCEAPGFDSAGPHWNPTERAHGSENPAGPHHGDLPNLTVDASGRGTLNFRIAGASTTEGAARLFDEDGAAVVIHAQPDDYRTDPSGNSGARIACGQLARPG